MNTLEKTLTASDTNGNKPLALQTRAAILEPARIFDADSLERAMVRLAESGWNAVVLPLLLEGYTISYSQVWADHGLRPQHPKFKKWDPYQLATDLASELGLDLVVSLQPYLVGKGRGWRRLPAMARKNSKWLAMRHPNRKQRNAGEAQDGLKYYCPANIELRRFLCDTLHTLLEDYPFHGMLIDLRHYPFYTQGEGNDLPFCYCQTCREATLRDLGFDPAGVDFNKEKSLVERWKTWQTEQMDNALAHIRMRVLRARRSMRIIGLLTTDSGLAEDAPRPLIHWKTWAERSLVEALVLDRYEPSPQEFSNQVRQDLKMLPKTSLLIPMIPQKAESGTDFVAPLEFEPVPGFMSRFEDWDLPEFNPAARISFETAATVVEADPIASICDLFARMESVIPQEKEFVDFLRDLASILTRTDVRLDIARLMMVLNNIVGLREQVAEGRIDLGVDQDSLLHDLDLAVRLTYLASCDLIQ